MASGAMASNCARNSALVRIFSGCVTAMPAASAVCLTGGAASCWVRPAGRSGWVTTRGISWPAARRASRVGTAKRGVPQKTSFIGVLRAGRRIGVRGFPPFRKEREWTGHGASLPLPAWRGLPLARALHFADLAQVEVALEGAHAEDEQHAVEVVDFVLKGAREQLFAFHLKPLALLVLGADFYLEGAHHLLANVGEAEAAFFLILFVFAEGDFGIDEHELLRGILAGAEGDHGDALGHAHPRGRPERAPRATAHGANY